MLFSQEDTLDFIANHSKEMLQLAREADFKTLAYLFEMVREESATIQAALRDAGVKTAFEAIESGAIVGIATNVSSP